MQLKGLAISSALQMVLVVLVGGTVMAVVGGPMLGQIEDGFNVLGDMTTSTTLNISDEATFSAAADYVYHRASNDGCKAPDETSKTTVQDRINNNAYEELQGTFLGREPPCIATDDATGADMEGKASRVEFVVDETSDGLKFNSGGQLWFEQRMRGAANQGIYEATKEECSQDVLGSGFEGAAYGAVMGSSSPDPVTTASGAAIGFGVSATLEAAGGTRFIGTKDKFVFYFKQGDADQRTDAVLDADNGFGESIYCYALTDQALNANPLDGTFLQSPLDDAYEDEFGGDMEIDLCPGDRGYIQMNKGDPQNDGEAGESIWGWAYKYPFIMITQTSTSSCSPS